MPTNDLASLSRESDFPIDAFLFVQRGLDFTVRRIHGEPPEQEEPVADADDGLLDVEDLDAATPSRHVSGYDLCQGLRDYAIQEYGLLARTVLKHMKIRRCEDFGRVVFLMVDAGLMHKTDEDSIEDFRDVFDFANAFGNALLLTGNT